MSAAVATRAWRTFVRGALAGAALLAATFVRPAEPSAHASSSSGSSAASCAGQHARSRGLWVWTTRELLADPGPLLSACAQTGTNEVYLAVNHDTLGDPRMAEVVARLGRASIRVEALMGDPSWYLPENVPQMIATIDDVLAFDARNAVGFTAIHLDVEPHVIPGNLYKGVMAYLPVYVSSMQKARDEASRGRLPIDADVPGKYFGSEVPAATKRALTSTVPRFFLLLYQLKNHGEDAEIAQTELAAASENNVHAGYDPQIVLPFGQMVIGLSVADYPKRFGTMSAVVDRTNGTNPAYGGFALHDFSQLRAALK